MEVGSVRLQNYLLCQFRDKHPFNERFRCAVVALFHELCQGSDPPGSSAGYLIAHIGCCVGLLALAFAFIWSCLAVSHLHLALVTFWTALEGARQYSGVELVAREVSP